MAGFGSVPISIASIFRTGSGSDRIQLHFLDSDLNFRKKPDHLCKSMAKMDTEPHPESKIWRLTGFGAGSGVLVFGSDSESIFPTMPISVEHFRKSAIV